MLELSIRRVFNHKTRDEKSLLVPTVQCSNRFEPKTEKRKIPNAANEVEALGSSEKGVELGFGLRNEKALLIEREWSGGVEQGLGQN